MANIYLDTEFLEGTQKTFFGKTTKPTIDLISIGLVDQNGREYYAISNEFNLREAWDRWDKVPCCNMPSMCISKIEGHCEGFKRDYWIRENVLRPIYDELLQKETYARRNHWQLIEPFSYKSLKTLIRWNGKTNIQIANEICEFIYGPSESLSGESALEEARKYEISDKSKIPVFYAYFGSYDWVAFCWLFGKMIDLPKGFPMYCKDLKQIYDKAIDHLWFVIHVKNGDNRLQYGQESNNNFIDKICESKEDLSQTIRNAKDYPKQTNEHNALADAKFNLALHEYLKKL